MFEKSFPSDVRHNLWEFNHLTDDCQMKEVQRATLTECGANITQGGEYDANASLYR